jgi:hydrogenase maturation factor
MLQAEIHHRASPEMIQTLQQAAQSSTRRAYVGEQEIIVGNYGQDGTTIFVSETMERLRRSVWNDLVLRQNS